MSELQTFLCVALELQDVATGFCLARFQRIEQFFKFSYSSLGLGLSLGFASGRGVLQFGTRFVQFFLSLAALLFELGEQFFGISQSLRAGGFKVFKQAARQLLEQMQRGTYWLLFGRHDLPPD